MMYVPLLKTRAEEIKVVKELKPYFSDKIIPLFEIINEVYKPSYKKDDNGEVVLERHKTRMLKVKSKPTEADIITLEYINETMDGKQMFIDYFRFSLNKYGKNISIKKAELAFNLNNDLELYKTKLLGVTRYDNMIPVISLKPDCEFSHAELVEFVKKLQENTFQIALRVTEEYIEQAKDIIRRLRKTDFLLFDIEEQNPETKFMEIMELTELQMDCRIILLNSPRKSALNNGEYPEHDQTDLIDNCARRIAEENDLSGYGDYCGLKDVMPKDNRSNGTGAALALLYEYKKNVFYSYCNHDTSLGVRGYRTLLPLIKGDEVVLNPDNDCPGYAKINSLPQTGTWRTWNYITAVRYIYQTYKNI